MNGILYLVAMPIGNREDLSPRAAEVLKSVDLILCEDTRDAGLSLSEHAPFLSYHLHNERKRNPELIERLKAGQNLALISDAGMPLISDPGHSLVQCAIQEGILVTALPGPNAALTALVASGLQADRFAFEGFLGKTDRAIRARLNELKNEPRTLLFYEAPHRLLRFLDALQKEGYNERLLVLGRELTKPYEEYERGTVDSLGARYKTKTPRGEYVLVLEGFEAYQERKGGVSLDQEALARELLMKGLDQKTPLKVLCKEVAETTGLKNNRLYELALELKKDR